MPNPILSILFSKVGIFICIGLISPLSLVYNSHHFIIYNLKALSPLPIVFSDRAVSSSKFENQRYEKYRFIFFKDDHNFVTKVFNRKYYKKLPGPHKYKVFHFVALNRKSFVTNPKNTVFYQKMFCHHKDSKVAFGVEFEIQKVEIHTDNKVLHEVQCL